jgi:hypothetical protein
MGDALFPLLWWRVLQTGNCCRLYLFKVCQVGPPTPTFSGRLCSFKICVGACSSPFSGALKAPHPLCYVSFSVLCLLFSFLFFVFSRAGVMSRGLYWFIPGVVVGVPGAAYLLTFGLCLPSMFGVGIWGVREASWFLSATWHGEALCWLGVWGVRVLLLLGGFSFQVWLKSLSKVSALQSSCYLLPPSSHHIGSPQFSF